MGFNSDVTKEWSGWDVMMAVCLPPRQADTEGCLIRDQTSNHVYVMHNDNTRNWISAPTAGCNAKAQVVASLPPKRHGGQGAYELDAAQSVEACKNTGCHMGPVQATAPTQSAPVSDTSGGDTSVDPSNYLKAENLYCGHCNNVDPTFGPGGEKWQSATRDDVSGCMATCDAHEDCLGFNYSDSHGKCWFRNTAMDCNVGADADR